MAQMEYWVGSCHLEALSADARRWGADANEAVCDVVVLCQSAEEMRARVAAFLGQAGMKLVWLESVEPLLSRFRRDGMSPKLAGLARKTSTGQPFAFGEMRPILPEAALAEALTEEIEDQPPVSFAEIDWGDLFASDQAPVWAVIDGVNCRDAAQVLDRSEAQSACLYTTTDAATRAMAPWLVRLEEDSDVLAWFKTLSHDQHWGIVLQSHATLKKLRAHLRKFTMLWTPANDQAPVYFRFYDPRVAVDMVQALESWKLARFMAPITRLIAPLSPLMILPEDQDLPEAPLPLDIQTEACQNRLVAMELHPDHREPSDQSKTFSINPIEFGRFAALQRQKANRKLARELFQAYPGQSPDAALTAVQNAVTLGQTHKMTSRKQVKTLAKCITEFGNGFENEYSEVKQILSNTKTQPWRKRDLIEKWIPNGRVYRDFRMPIISENNTIRAWIEAQGDHRR